jgi:hypothetical protein
MGLNEESALCGIETERKKLSCCNESAATKKRRLGFNSQSMKINNTIKGIVILLEIYPLFDCAEIISKMERVSCRLDP